MQEAISISTLFPNVFSLGDLMDMAYSDYDFILKKAKERSKQYAGR